MSFEYGTNLRIQIFGESHAKAIGVTIDGLPAGCPLDLAAIGQLLARRMPGQNAWSTGRREPDLPEIVCGLQNQRTTGAPLTALFANTDTKSSDYQVLQTVPRPGHSDFPSYLKFGGAADARGGGAFSGRLTAPLCFAGGVALQLLLAKQIRIYAQIASIAAIEDTVPDFAAPDENALASLASKAFPVLSDTAAAAMQDAVCQAKAAGDSLGGSIRCFALGLPVGLGRHMFAGVENRLAAALFGIPGVKAIEFGSGFAGCASSGAQNNDPFAMEEGRVVTTKNDAGGCLGGMTNGMPLLFRVGVKPTPSISLCQQSVDLATGEPATLQIHGRHDPCIVPRAVPVVEAMTALVLLDLLLDPPSSYAQF